MPNHPIDLWTSKKKIRNNSHRNTDIDMSSIKMQLEDDTENGAMHCNF